MDPISQLVQHSTTKQPDSHLQTHLGHLQGHYQLVDQPEQPT